MEFLSVFTGDDSYEEVKPLIVREKDKGTVINMCWVAQNLIAEGKSQGIKIGEAKGILQTLNSLVADKIIGVDEAAKRAGMTVDEYTKAVEELQVNAVKQM